MPKFYINHDISIILNTFLEMGFASLPTQPYLLVATPAPMTINWKKLWCI